MICRIGYTVPLTVEVDTEAGVINRVVVAVEETKHDRDDLIADGKVVVTEDFDQIEDPAVRATALMIADERDWPQWEFGW